MIGTTLKLVPKDDIPEEIAERGPWNNYVVYLPTRDENGNYKYMTDDNSNYTWGQTSAYEDSYGMETTYEGAKGMYDSVVIKTDDNEEIYMTYAQFMERYGEKE